MKKPLLSVLMPVFNSEQFLFEAIESVLNQSFKDFEFIIIDDASTDSSKEIIRAFSDSRIRFYENHENLGITATLNKGIELAHAEFIARMDSDDICLPERFQRQYDFIKLHPDGALFSCWALEIKENGEPIKIEQHNPAHYYFNLTFACWVYHPTMVYRKDAVQSVGKYTTPYSEDFELIWQISRKFKIYHLPEALLKYRVNSKSLSNNSKRQEYSAWFLKQVSRNILYYNGDPDFPIKEWQLKILSHSYNLNEDVFTLDQIMEAVGLLDFITKKILEKNNLNLDSAEVKMASKQKRRYILSRFCSRIGYLKGAILLIRTKSFGLLWKLAKNSFQSKFFKGIT